jgi:hypothetical protein
MRAEALKIDRDALLAQTLSGAFPDERGRFGPFGGRYVPETLVPALDRLEDAVSVLQSRAGETLDPRPTGPGAGSPGRLEGDLARLARAVTEQAAAELTAIGWPDDLSVNVDMSSLPWLDSSIDEWVPELIEKYHLREGQLRLHVWSDINQEDATHTIDLMPAIEALRRN